MLTADERTALAKVKWSAENMTSIGQLTHGDIKALATLGDRLTATLAAQPAANFNDSVRASLEAQLRASHAEVLALRAQAQPAAGQVARISEAEARTLRDGLHRFAVQETRNAARSLIELLAATGSGK